MKKIAVLIALVACVAIAFAAVAVAADSRPSQKAQARMDSLAERNVQAERQWGAMADSPVNGLAQYRDSETGDEYVFDGRGIVRSATFASVLKTTDDRASASLSDRELLSAAERYVAEFFPNTDASKTKSELKRRVCGEEKDGTKHEEVVVEFREYYKGVRSPNFVLLNLDPATGAVGIVNHDEGEFDVDVTPSADASAAVEKIARKAGFKGFSQSRSELILDRDPTNWKVRLVWSVEARTGNGEFGAAAEGIVDAKTGEMLETWVSD